MPSQRRAEPVDHPRSEVYTVSRLNLEARAVLDGHFPPLWIEGEISNLARPRSGHLYFSLKDEQCQVRCAMFRMRNRLLDFEPRDGIQVLVQAKVGLYPERGEFQLIAQYMEEAGAGALRRAFEALKQRLHTEGLFDPARKRALPLLPRAVGVITSPTGAALRDVASVLARRFPAVAVRVYPVPVQGADAPGAIVEALRRAQHEGACDVLVVARGGGSLEDLWAFNEEVVARAMFACTIPIVTGIGHETDFTIADLVADLRAPTPSAAAESVVPDAAEWRDRFASAESRLIAAGERATRRLRERSVWLSKRLVHPSRRLQDLFQRLDSAGARLARAVRSGQRERRARVETLASRLHRHQPSAVLRHHRQSVGSLERRLRSAASADLAARRGALAALARAVDAYGPRQTLERGYSILTRDSDGAIVRSAGEVTAGERIGARVSDGFLGLEVRAARRIAASVPEGVPDPAE